MLHVVVNYEHEGKWLNCVTCAISRVQSKVAIKVERMGADVHVERQEQMHKGMVMGMLRMALFATTPTPSFHPSCEAGSIS